ncbi:unnamed protein product (macronuclear) [Paramecium tetraurelia]|uniref:Uncharacterized protein n=1 Tax=Paramecium tetraurelia TaxID=5888 RepID=A0CX66_PARTE|nr:uncharacterized protein GSPATT00001587001 [Paramecium tetraurelia]CAK75383.1 unnamed protein product [Paramecium tetraurelia]|eukprot:XP_001442780.1 hypothetical protein (macronuclear) [Paramecium tetraurelia strain d4-2]
MNLSFVSFLSWGLQEAKQFYYARSDFEQNKNKLAQLITEVTEKLRTFEQYWHQLENTNDNENINFIKEVKDILDRSSQLKNSLPSQQSIVQCYQMRKEQINEKLLETLNTLEEQKNKIDLLVQNTRNIMQTVIILPPKQVKNNQIYKIQLKLKLKATPQIKKIFDDHPHQLKTEYNYEFEMEESGSSNKNIYTFKRNDFSLLGQFQSTLGLNIESLSKQNHCSLQMRYRLNFPNKKVQQNPLSETPTPASEQESVIISQQDQFNYSDKFSLFLIVNGKNAVKIIRDKSSISLNFKQELELQKSDQIVFFQNSEDLPLLSYVVQNIHITKKQAQPYLEYQQN